MLQLEFPKLILFIPCNYILLLLLSLFYIMVSTNLFWKPFLKDFLNLGTSILQGAVACRPGMSYTAILGYFPIFFYFILIKVNHITRRWLGTSFLNLGFSGNGQMQPEVVPYLAQLDPSAYIIDCLPNMDASLVKQVYSLQSI